jgi:hypothetical protein
LKSKVPQKRQMTQKKSFSRTLTRGSPKLTPKSKIWLHLDT